MVGSAFNSCSSIFHSQTPSTTKLLPGHSSRSKTTLAFLSHGTDQFDESVCEAAEGNPLHVDELKSSLSSFFQSSQNLFDLPKPTETSIPDQPWQGFCLRTKKITIEGPKKVKDVNPNPLSTIYNPEPKPSFVLDSPNPQSQPIHSPDICPSPDDTPQDRDKSHLSDSTSTTTNLNESCSLDTSYDHLIHLDSPSLSSELLDTSSVKSIEIQFVANCKETNGCFKCTA